MALTYLSGDDIGRKRKSGGQSGGAKKQQRQAKRQTKQAARRAAKPAKTKAEKKQGRKRVFKKVAKVAIAPARAAFLTVVSLNALKLATKMVRVWQQPNGKATLTKFWQGFGGNMAALKKAIIKGSKQQISADEIGAAGAVTAAIATATPIIVALVPIIKNFKAAGSKQEAAEFNEGVNEGKKELAESEDVPKARASMPKNKDAGVMVDKDGEAQEDPKETKRGRAESETGGEDGEDGEDGEKKKLMKSGAGGAESEDEKTKAARAKMASNWSPLGFYFMALMYLMAYKPTGLIFQMFGFYCFVGMLLIPVAITKNPLQKFARFISFAPIETIDKLILKIKSKWQNYLITKPTN